MKFFGFTVLALGVLTQAADYKVKETHGIVDSVPIYTKSSNILRKDVPRPEEYAYVTQRTVPVPQQYLTEQRYYQPASQQDASISQQDDVSKYTSASQAAQKYSYAAQPQVKAPQFSLAADVSSFSYSSPVVSYNSQGLLKQLAGNIAETSQASSQYNVPAATKSQYVSSQKVQYAPAPSQSAYSHSSNTYPSNVAPSNEHLYSSSPIQYTSSQSAYSSAPTYSAADNSHASPSTYSSSHNPNLSAGSGFLPSQSAYSSPANAYENNNYQQVTQTRYVSAQQPIEGTEQRVNTSPSYQIQKVAVPQINYSSSSPQQYQSSASYQPASQSKHQFYVTQPAERHFYPVRMQTQYVKPGVSYIQ